MRLMIRGIAASLFVLMLGACNGGDSTGLTAATRGDAAESAASCGGTTPVTDLAPPETALYTLDPLGPMADVTCRWQQYQPADAFCVKLDGIEFAPGGAGELTDGADPACRNSGFPASETGLYKVQLDTPTLCPGCRRIFLDFSRIPADKPDQQIFYAHGHAYYHVSSLNPTYTVEPDSHSPNTKNFYNDKLVSPPGTPVEQLIGAIDTHDMAYVTDTAHFIHTAIQGGHYIGPWYVNRAGQRVHGVYLDVNVANATSLGEPHADAFFYQAGYNSGHALCDAIPGTADADLLYGGCVDRIGGSSIALNPFE